LAHASEVVIVETRAFTSRVLALLSDEDYRSLQLELLRRPGGGAVIPGVPMRKALFDELLESVREGGAILRGEQAASREFLLEDPDVRSLRESYGLSQPKFAALLGISVGTLRNWEQGRRRPEGSARVLLRIVAKHPDAVLDVATTMLK
jgi:putative transcriptional regulator